MLVNTLIPLLVLGWLSPAVEIGSTNLGRASKGDRSPRWVSQLDGDCVDQNSRARYSLQLPGDTLHLDKR